MTLLETVVRRDRAVVLVGLVGLAAVAWGYIAHSATGMTGVDAGGMRMTMAMPQAGSWGVVDLALLFVMWVVMMTAMMLPAAAPLLLMHAAITRTGRERRSPVVPTAVFLLGYLLVWTGYSGAAALAQWGLHRALLLRPAMVSTSPVLGGALLVVAGVYQFTPLKQACLAHCRSPFGFITTEWRDGVGGALRMGVKHGAYCVGCCWVLMALLFVVGVMNLLWVVTLAAFVLLEKVGPSPRAVSRVAGVLLAGWGAWLLAGALATEVVAGG